jgi:beta-lactamase superfamily II metal-dependent hydrolase
MEIFILDVGTTKFGDSILITHGGKTILIDGAHPGDQDLLEKQIKKILGTDPPFDIDLLVVTHCHLDHIGCLPTLIRDGTIVPKTALVADEKLGFGRTDDGIGPTDAADLTDAQKVMIIALQEEDHSDLPDDELQKFLEDGITLEERYIEMLQKLDDDDCSIIRYGDHTAQDLEDLEESFDEFGLKILGPSDEHLIICAQTIAGVSDDINQDVFNDLSDDVPEAKLVDTYRQLMKKVKEDADLEDAESQASAAKNNQSIVIKVAASGWSALLAGDMQYAAAGVTELKDLMPVALQEAVDAGPYDFIKITHHTASNGLSQEVFDAFSPCKLFAHTGGKNDATHPNKKALQILKANASQIKFSRTDRNGMITVKKGTKVKMVNSKGTFNNFSLNTAGDSEQLPIASTNPETARVQFRSENVDGEYVEVVARIPNQSTRVTITVEIDPEKKKPELRQSIRNSSQLGGGRKFPGLLFVSCRSLLERNIGQVEATAALRLITSCPDVELLEIEATSDVDVASKKVHQKIRSNKYAGVVIVGGYDVVPSKVLDVLDEELRLNIRNFRGRKDQDNFIVWSDEVYVDLDGDSLPELPISRIPDARRPDLVISALTAQSFSPAGCFGVRNIERPFADHVYKNIPGSAVPMNVSETFAPALLKGDVAAGAVYYMLHGSDRDSTLFWGESREVEEEDNTLFDAVSIENVPSNAEGTIVFAGCCWGALTVMPKAVSLQANKPIIPKPPEDSIALTYLLRGALAFVGCTGTHYSPGQEPFDYYGRPMHDLFWTEISKGKSPAEALWQSKQVYAVELPHGQMDVYSRGIEIKILRQFTCLGLGW